jgi:hypothetical protein
MITTQSHSAQTFPRERAAKEEGDITSVFLSNTENKPSLPARFSELKKQLWKDSFVESWHGVLEALKEKTEEVAQKGSSVRLSFREFDTSTEDRQVVPKVDYSELQAGLTPEKIAEIKEAGVVIIRGAVPKEVWLTCSLFCFLNRRLGGP